LGNDGFGRVAAAAVRPGHPKSTWSSCLNSICPPGKIGLSLLKKKKKKGKKEGRGEELKRMQSVAATVEVCCRVLQCVAECCSVLQ